VVRLATDISWWLKLGLKTGKRELGLEPWFTLTDGAEFRFSLGKPLLNWPFQGRVSLFGPPLIWGIYRSQTHFWDYSWFMGALQGTPLGLNLTGFVAGSLLGLAQGKGGPLCGPPIWESFS